ncbi:hypothetical protein ACQGS6_13480 [Bacillus sp. GMs2/2]|uniref:Uncharacterized protein n=1 Tax=Bacillus thuringiensis subsp. medellin TaxID=79672 RepID=A0A9X6MME4_BACTV|nr:hypothetical protein [Bacillus thuringiensis]OUB84015.1 hypothetical protein BK784_37150 [Bacillus thuringiensis serovar medellin]
MSYDTIASLQRMQRLEQAQAAAGKRLVLQRDHKTDNILAALAIILAIPTFCLSLILGVIIYYIREFTCKTYLVKNVATGEKFHVDKQEFKEYKRNFKKKKKQVRRISDL